MSLIIGTDEVERFRSIIAEHLGLQFEDAKFDFLGEVLRRRLDATGRPCAVYLATDPSPGELGALAQELTVGETYFFRHNAQFRAFADHAIPDRRARHSGTRRFRVLSAGCASGEEAYTLAMILRDLLEPSETASVLAVDVNPAVLAKAQRGRFSEWALRETTDDARQRWFSRDGRDMVLDQTIRTMVQFEWHNLAEEDPVLWSADTYDVVFCRNVLMYLTPDVARAVVNRISRSLAPGGFLFLGHADTMRGLSSDFHLCHRHETFYYQRKDGVAGEVGREAPVPAVGAGVTGVALAASVNDADTWVDAIQSATDRVQQLVDSPRSAAGGSASGNRARLIGWDLGQPFELLRQERFAEALDLVESLPSEAGQDPDVLLLHAVLLIHSAVLGRAEDACKRLLAIDELSAGAHYLLALCRESAGDCTGALEHDRVATYLDPSFAMPRLHRGLLARRAGDFDTMRRELADAIMLLEREDAARLLLFGGGFSRHALIALCGAELAAEGTP